MAEVDEVRQRRVVAEVGAAWQMWVVAEVGFFCVNFDLIFFFFFVGHLLDSDFAIGLI